jgi:hypothetical protein
MLYKAAKIRLDFRPTLHFSSENHSELSALNAVSGNGDSTAMLVETGVYGAFSHDSIRNKDEIRSAEKETLFFKLIILAFLLF